MLPYLFPIFPAGFPYHIHLAIIPYRRGIPLRVAALIRTCESQFSDKLGLSRDNEGYLDKPSLSAYLLLSRDNWN